MEQITKATSSSGYVDTVSNLGYMGVAFNSGHWGSASNEIDEGIATNFGKDGKVKGCLGSWIVCDEWSRNDKGTWHRVDVKVAKVDGKKIKANTWYRLEKGEFVEAV